MGKPLNIKNASSSIKRVVGRDLNPGETMALSQYSYQALRASNEILGQISTGELVINNGLDDLLPTDGHAYVVNEVSINPTFLGGEGMVIPVGSNNMRPFIPQQGMIRFNTATNSLEIYVANTWVQFGASVATKKKVACLYNTSIQTITKSFSHIVFNTVGRQDGIVSINDNTRMVFSDSGWYRIMANVGFDVSSDNETIVETVITLDGVTVPGSTTFTYHPKKGFGEATSLIGIFVNAIAGETMAVSSRVKAGNASVTTVPHTCRILVEEID